MAKSQTERTAQYRKKMKRVEFLVDPSLAPILENLKQQYGSVSLGLQELLKKYEDDKRY